VTFGLATLGAFSFTFPTDLSAIIVLLVALVILWIVVSLPVYAAGKLLTEGKSGLGEAMGATLGGALVYFIVFWGVAFFLGPILGQGAIVLGFFLALIAWLAVYRASFDTSWLGTFGIVLVAWLVFFVLDVFLVATFGVTFPKFYPF
jgi:hypothetical protein